MSVRLIVVFAGFCMIPAISLQARLSEPPSITWAGSMEQGVRMASQTGRPLLLYFHSANCGFCRKLERDTWADPSVIKFVSENFVALRIDGEKDAALMDRFGLQGFPAVVVLSRNGNPLAKLEGYRSPGRLLKSLNEMIRSSARPSLH